MKASEKTPARRNQTACEACRATKIRCQPSDQPGVCRKCLESKRECVSRTGPRIRRPKRPRIVQEEGQPPTAQPPLSGPSSTFSIDFDVATPAEADNSFDILKETHADMLDRLFPPEDDDCGHCHQDHSIPSSGRGIAEANSSPQYHHHYQYDGGDTLPTPPGSTRQQQQSRSIENLHGKPQFNLVSAEGLLRAFHRMLETYPVLVLEDNATVPALAASRPFVLLAILASASGSRTLQGHSLYDDEFRKVLALKFVAGGERTLELLQGILIYCAWYPFHLRPKNKQVYHYMRMAGDLVTDLDLDQEFRIGDLVTGEIVTERQLDHMRAYLCYLYTVSSYSIAWRRHRALAAPFTSWTMTCCDVLDAHGTSPGDSVLAAMVRFSAIASDAVDATLDRGPHITDQQSRLLLLGLEARASQLRASISPAVASLPHMRIAASFVDCYLGAGSILRFPRRPKSGNRGSRPAEEDSVGVLPPDGPKLHTCARNLRSALDFFLSLEPSIFACFTGVDWCRFILCIILSFQLCFLPDTCPTNDADAVRDTLRLGDFLTSMSSSSTSPPPSSPGLTPATNSFDVLSASKVVLSVVQEKYERKLRNREAKKVGCPMIDGSMDDYLSIWDPAFNVGNLDVVMGTATGAPTGASPSSGDAAGGGSRAATTGEGVTAMPVFHDLWATMTIGWANEHQPDAPW